jgi:preprotein translocase subunit SecB
VTFDPTRQPGIRIAQIVVERALFAHRGDYLDFEPSTSLAVEDLSVNLEFGVSPDQRAGLVRLRVQTSERAKALYEFDVLVVGLVEMDPNEKKQNMPVERYLATSGAALLYPFVRELVANLTGRGRFGPLWLAPLNIVASIAPAQRIAANR